MLLAFTAVSMRIAQWLHADRAVGNLVFAEHHSKSCSARVGALHLRFEAGRLTIGAAMQDHVEAGIAQAFGDDESLLASRIALMDHVHVAAFGFGHEPFFF